MSEFTSFQEKPSRADAPATCQWDDCDTKPQQTVRFVNPAEYVCYCSEHTDEIFRELPGAKYRGYIR